MMKIEVYVMSTPPYDDVVGCSTSPTFRARILDLLDLHPPHHIPIPSWSYRIISSSYVQACGSDLAVFKMKGASCTLKLVQP